MRKRNIVLASASPRRSELMHMLGFSDMIIHPADGANTRREEQPRRRPSKRSHEPKRKRLRCFLMKKH